MKYFVFSLDDGTLWDVDTIALFNKYGFKATFNLNSGLQDFVWYYKDRIAIRRLKLEETKHLYDGHEIASHTLTHPYLDSCDDGRVVYEINQDISNLENIFNREIISFATPFQTCGDREVNLIKNNTKIQSIRMSILDESFQIPSDPYHIKCSTYEIHHALELINRFIEDPNAKLFVYAGHSYDFYVNDTFEEFEELLRILDAHKNEIKVLTMSEMVSEIYNN